MKYYCIHRSVNHSAFIGEAPFSSGWQVTQRPTTAWCAERKNLGAISSLEVLTKPLAGELI